MRRKEKSPSPKLFEERRDGAGTRNIPTKLTPTERKLKRQLSVLSAKFRLAETALHVTAKKCTHRVRYDVAGMPWDSRYCAICSTYLGAI